MNKTAYILLSVLTSVVLVVGICASSYISNYNYGNRAEKTISSEYKNMENILAQYSLKVTEAAQIPAMQTEDLVKIFTSTLPARYYCGQDSCDCDML